MLPRPAMRSSRSPIVEQVSERALHAARIQKRRHALEHQEERDRGDEIRQVGQHGRLRRTKACAGRSALGRLAGLPAVPGSLKYLKNSPSGEMTSTSPSLPSERS